jgi:hypothetical protein
MISVDFPEFLPEILATVLNERTFQFKRLEFDKNLAKQTLIFLILLQMLIKRMKKLRIKLTYKTIARKYELYSDWLKIGSE